MAIEDKTEGQHFLCEQSVFNTLVMTSGLHVGGIYFVDKRIYLAIDDNKYQQMSELRIIPSLPAADAATVEKGVIYYAVDTKLLAVAVTGEEDEEWAYLNNAYVDVIPELDGVYLVKADGTKKKIPIPTVDVGAGTAGELVSANTDGELERSGKTIAGIMSDVDTEISTAVDTLESELTDLIDGKIDKIASPVENEIVLADDAGGVKLSGKKFVTTIAKTLDAYSDNEIPSEKAIVTEIQRQVQEALEGNRFRGTFTIGDGDTQITDTLTLEAIGIGDNWSVIGTPGATGTFLGVPISVGDTIIFKNKVDENGTITTADFVIKPYIGADIVDSLDADQAGDAFRALSAKQGNVLDNKKLDKLANGAANEVILSTATGIKRSGLGIVDTIKSETVKRFELSSWVSDPIDADFNGTVGTILDTITPGTEAAPWEGTVAGRTVRVWAKGSAYFIDVVLLAGDDEENFTLTLDSGAFDSETVVTTTTEGIPTAEAVIDAFNEKLGEFETATLNSLDTKIDKTSTGGADEILVANGAGGAAKSGKKIASSINEAGTGNADLVPNVEAVVDYVQQTGFRWIVLT